MHSIPFVQTTEIRLRRRSFLDRLAVLVSLFASAALLLGGALAYAVPIGTPLFLRSLLVLHRFGRLRTCRRISRILGFRRFRFA